MKLLLDSHVLLWWWCCPALLSSKVQVLLRAPDQPVVVSAASLWELSLAVEEGKLPEPAGGAVAHAWKAPQPDAVDRFLLAQAQSEGLSLVSSDLALRGQGVPVIW
jgi:PIN domain nuclease of toxin-antitoxin system